MTSGPGPEGETCRPSSPALWGLPSLIMAAGTPQPLSLFEADSTWALIKDKVGELGQLKGLDLGQLWEGQVGG